MFEFSAKHACVLNRLNHIQKYILFYLTGSNLIQPIIDYGGEIFYDRKPKPRLKSLQTTYLKRALGVRVQTSNLAILVGRDDTP